MIRVKIHTQNGEMYINEREYLGKPFIISVVDKFTGHILTNSASRWEALEIIRLAGPSGYNQTIENLEEGVK